MRTVIMCATAVLVGLAAATAAPVPKAAKKQTVEERLIGKWVMTGSDNGLSSNFYVVYKKGGEMEFRYEDNTGQARTTYPGKFKAGEPDDTYKLGSIDWTVNQGAGERGEVSKILELTDDVLEFVDPQGVKEKFRRVTDEAGEKKDK